MVPSERSISDISEYTFFQIRQIIFIYKNQFLGGKLTFLRLLKPSTQSPQTLLLNHTNYVLCRGFKIYNRNMLTHSLQRLFNPLCYTGYNVVPMYSQQNCEIYSCYEKKHKFLFMQELNAYIYNVNIFLQSFHFSMAEQ